MEKNWIAEFLRRGGREFCEIELGGVSTTRRTRRGNIGEFLTRDEGSEESWIWITIKMFRRDEEGVFFNFSVLWFGIWTVTQ